MKSRGDCDPAAGAVEKNEMESQSGGEFSSDLEPGFDTSRIAIQPSPGRPVVPELAIKSASK